MNGSIINGRTINGRTINGRTINGSGQPGQRSRVGLLVALGTATAMALAGCAGQVAAPASATPTPATPTPGTSGADGSTNGTAGSAAVAWTSTICQALTPVVGTLRAPPAIDVTDPAAAQRAYDSYLGAAQTQAEQAQQAVDGAGPPPLAGGEDLARKVRDQVSELRQDVVDARGRIEAADPTNPLAIGQAVVAGGNVLGALGNNAQAVDAMTTGPELRSAFQLAPACVELRKAGIPT